MAEITVSCKCGEKIKIDVKTIDRLKNELIIITRERDNLRALVAAMKAKKNDIFSQFF